MKKLNTINDARYIWDICGSFGEAVGEVNQNGDKITFSGNGYSVASELEKHEEGVVLRRGMLKNESDKKLVINHLSSKFVFNGGEYEVYTQYNGWQNESAGGWQKLVTAVKAESTGVRAAMGAAPFVVLWNNQTGRGTAFHLLASSAWEITVTKMYEDGETSTVEVELGINSRNFMLELEPGESVALPEIVYYDVINKTDLDCWKLHNYCNKVYPERTLPVVFNTWFYKFDAIDYENVSDVIEAASKIGAEYFVIDAGWFGVGGNWYVCRGDWTENMTGAFAGRMKDVADKVREHGMKFGFWLEAESAHRESSIVKELPQYFFEYNGRYYIDFANPDAVEYIYGVTDGLINKYGAEFIKFDFNQNTPFDVNHNSFIDYYEGHRRYIEKIKTNHPEVYLENCASGGMRTNLNTCRDFESVWVTDNQSPYDGLRIFKDSILRMPPQMMEKWVALHSLSDFGPAYYSSKEKILSTDDATWDRAVSIDISFLEGFLTGGPVGFTCDLNQLSDVTFERLQSFVSEFKSEREFWKKAVCRILTDTKDMLVLEYSDMFFENVKLVVFSNRIYQRNIEVYPVLDKDADYVKDDGTVISGAELICDGLDVTLEGNYRCVRINLKKN